VVYTAFSRSLAALETLVHVEDVALAAAYVALPAEFDDQLIAVIGKAELPATWRGYPHSAATRAIGDAWIERGRTPVLRVPSAVLPFALEHEPLEVNYLLNPAHVEFGKIRRGAPVAFEFDARLGR
jgi:RES domain-containing protein